MNEYLPFDKVKVDGEVVVVVIPTTHLVSMFHEAHTRMSVYTFRLKGDNTLQREFTLAKGCKLPYIWDYRSTRIIAGGNMDSVLLVNKPTPERIRVWYCKLLECHVGEPSEAQ